MAIPDDYYQADNKYDKKYLQKWIDWGFDGPDGLNAYMQKVARFEDWCRRHPKEEQDETATPES